MLVLRNQHKTRSMKLVQRWKSHVACDWNGFLLLDYQEQAAPQDTAKSLPFVCNRNPTAGFWENKSRCNCQGEQRRYEEAGVYWECTVEDLPVRSPQFGLWLTQILCSLHIPKLGVRFSIYQQLKDRAALKGWLGNKSSIFLEHVCAAGKKSFCSPCLNKKTQQWQG